MAVKNTAGIGFEKKIWVPQTNSICGRFHKTILQEFYQVAFRRKLYHSLGVLQVDLDAWVGNYNSERTHQGKMCCGRTPMQTLLDEKQDAVQYRTAIMDGKPPLQGRVPLERRGSLIIHCSSANLWNLPMKIDY